MGKSFRLMEIAKWVDGVVRGDASTAITGVSSLGEACASEISWVAHERYLPQLRSSRAGAVVVAERMGATPMPAILCEKPELAMTIILDRFAPEVPRPPAGVHPTAVVAESARLGREVAVGPHVVIGEEAQIGEGSVLHAGVFVGGESRLGKHCELWPHVVVRERCTLGDRVVIHPNSTVGSDGYGYTFADGRHVKIPQIGAVEIGDDVEIGANCAIDRAKFGATRIGNGTKIDNQVQVAHNVQIGPHCLIVAQCGIAGSTRLGQGVVLGGKVGIKDHVELGDGAQVAACACLSKDVPAGRTVIGVPAVEREEFVRERARLKRLPELAEQVKSLVKRIEQLESSADHS